jgi:ABC-2 type transport system permease protein
MRPLGKYFYASPGDRDIKLHRIRAVILRHYYDTRRNINRIAEMLYWPVQNIVVWGFFTFYLSRDHHLQPGVITCLLSATILWGMFYAFQRDLTTCVLEELWSRNFLNLFTTPLDTSEYMTGLIAVNLLRASTGMAVAAATAWLCYADNLFPFALKLLPFILDLMIFALAIGVFTTALIIRYSTRIQTLAWSLAGLLMPFSCVLYPITSLPRSLRPIAWGLPTTHAFEGMRQVIAAGQVSGTRFKFALLLDVVYLLLAILLFRRMLRSAHARGLLVKLT